MKHLLRELAVTSPRRRLWIHRPLASRFFWVFVLACVLGGCAPEDHGFLNAAGPVAQAQREHFFSVGGWMMLVVLPLFALLPWTLWKYRSGAASTYRPDWTFSRSMEAAIWGVPIAVVGVLSWNLWHHTLDLDPYEQVLPGGDPLEIQVVSLDWKWLFLYPEQNIGAADQLLIPIDRPIRFRLTSGTVMQAFMIPRLGGQIYTMAGMTTELNLRATKLGSFRGLNTQYNGRGFARQKFDVTVVPPAAFDDWVDRVRRTAPPLDAGAYGDLAARSVLPTPRLFGRVPEDLFDDIVRAGRAGSKARGVQADLDTRAAAAGPR